MDSQTAGNLRLMLHGHNDPTDVIPESLVRMYDETEDLLRLFGGRSRLDATSLALLVSLWKRLERPADVKADSAAPVKKNPLATKLATAS